MDWLTETRFAERRIRRPANGRCGTHCDLRSVLRLQILRDILFHLLYRCRWTFSFQLPLHKNLSVPNSRLDSIDKFCGQFSL
jgi:hypothetical protein